MKFITISLTYDMDNKQELIAIVIPINCSSNDEPSIKHAIEERKNDPTVVIGILTRNFTKVPTEVTCILQQIRQAFLACSTISVKFIDDSVLTEFMETQMQKGKLLQYCPN